MSDVPQSRRGSTPVERWIQHVIQAVSVAAVLGGAVLLADLRTSNAVIENELKSLRARIDDFKVFMGDRYTESDARRDIQPLLVEIQDHETRIRKLEQLR